METEEIDVMMMGGALWHFGREPERIDLVTSFETINELVKNIYTWRNNKDAVLKDSTFPEPWGGDVFAGLAYAREFVSVACSQVVVGAICPLFEFLFIRAFGRFQNMFQQTELTKSHIRWTADMDEDKRWNPKFYYDKKDKKTKENLPDGYWQLLEAIGHADSISDLDAEIIYALFLYRNRVLHSGYEWPKNVRKKFCDVLKDRSKNYSRWMDWFEVGRDDNEPWIIASTKLLADDAMTSIKTVASKLRDIETELQRRQS